MDAKLDPTLPVFQPTESAEGNQAYYQEYGNAERQSSWSRPTGLQTKAYLWISSKRRAIEVAV
jgi:hypothetical protein